MQLQNTEQFVCPKGPQNSFTLFSLLGKLVFPDFVVLMHQAEIEKSSTVRYVYIK